MFSLFRSSTKVTSHAYFSPGETCLNAIITGINKAQRSIKICVFTISDDRITRAILQAHRKGIPVKILTDNEKLFDRGSDIRELAQAGIPVRIDNTPNHMHHKFAILDNEIVLTGSYNWTRSAALYNHENLITSDDKALVKDFSREFDRLWAEMVPFK
ncbi:phospholipase D-like domain-containing protein [Adhaeribacter aerolatus]|uniref:phospholipase D-like domain-containing protein n=1 Tax=Adhaeribacter aerolatus TaxID=670289 RepID=UPI0011BFAE82|nr:phospholipase D-like domain-containing protein [Adhaeribacter aerolatus]